MNTVVPMPSWLKTNSCWHWFEGCDGDDDDDDDDDDGDDGDDEQ